MLRSLLVNGRPVTPPDDDTERVTLQLCTGYATHCCRVCGEELAETIDGYEGTTTGNLTCSHPTGGGGEESAQRHDPQPIPLTWCNHAAIATNENYDAVTVIISVGDARGGFALSVHRMPDHADEHPGRLMLSVPHPGEIGPHALLSEVRPGTYLIGD